MVDNASIIGHDRLVARVKVLTDALECAPPPVHRYTKGSTEAFHEYQDWYNGKRKAALEDG